MSSLTIQNATIWQDAQVFEYVFISIFLRMNEAMSPRCFPFPHLQLICNQPLICYTHKYNWPMGNRSAFRCTIFAYLMIIISTRRIFMNPKCEGNFRRENAFLLVRWEQQKWLFGWSQCGKHEKMCWNINKCGFRQNFDCRVDLAGAKKCFQTQHSAEKRDTEKETEKKICQKQMNR